MAIKHGASCIDTAIHTTLLTLCRLQRESFLTFFYLRVVSVLVVCESGLSNGDALRDAFRHQRISSNCSLSLFKPPLEEVSRPVFLHRAAEAKRFAVYFTVT